MDKLVEVALTPRKDAIPVLDPRLRTFGRFFMKMNQLVPTRGLRRVQDPRCIRPL